MPDRRWFLLSAAASLAAPPARADIACYAPVSPYARPCEVGIPIRQVVPAQECQNWCWAACIETIFLLYGYRVSQRELAQKVFGSADVCGGATGQMIAYAVQGPWIDDGGQRFDARLNVVMDAQWGISHPDPIGLAWEELRAGRPLIIGTLGHAMVMTAMSFYEYANGGRELAGITVRDPWPENPNRRQLTPQEFYSVEFLATVAVA